MVKLIYFIGSLFCKNKVTYNVVKSVNYEDDEIHNLGDNVIRGVKLLTTPSVGEKIYFDDDGPFYIILSVSHRVIKSKHDIWLTVEEII